MRIWRDVAIHGDDLAGQLSESIDEMKHHLTSLGCQEFSLAYWSVDVPTRLRVEVRCRSGMEDLCADSNRPLTRACRRSTAGGLPR